MDAARRVRTGPTYVLGPLRSETHPKILIDDGATEAFGDIVVRLRPEGRSRTQARSERVPESKRDPGIPTHTCRMRSALWRFR